MWKSTRKTPANWRFRKGICWLFPPCGAASRPRPKLLLTVMPGNLFLPIHFGENPPNVLTNSEALDPLAKIPEFKVGKARVEKLME